MRPTSRSSSSGARRGLHRADGLRDRPEEEDPVDDHLSQTTGRNFDEILRVIDALPLTDAHRVATPVNWKQGEDVIIVPAVSDGEARAKFPNGWRALKPYCA